MPQRFKRSHLRLAGASSSWLPSFSADPSNLCGFPASVRTRCSRLPRHVPDPDTDPATTPRSPDSFQWEVGFSNHNLGAGVLAPTRLVTVSKLFLGAELEKNLKNKYHVHSASSDSNSGVQPLFNYANCLSPSSNVVSPTFP